MDSNEQKEEQDSEASLKAALTILHTQIPGDPHNLTQENIHSSIAALADASRTNIALRERLSTTQSLRALLDILCLALNEPTCSSILVTSALRCIGNACIDNDSARGVVLQAPDDSWATACLKHNDDRIVRTSLKVIYNLCVDYEPAQKFGYEKGLHEDLIALLSDGKPIETCIELDEAERGLGMELLFWMTNQRPAAPTSSQPTTGTEEDLPLTTSRQVRQGTLHRLLRLPYLYAPDLDTEDYAMVVEICLTYLRDPVVQQQVREYELVQYVWRMLWDNERKIQILQEKTLENDSEAEEIKMLIPLSTSLTWCLSDIAAIRVETGNPIDDTTDFEESLLHGVTELIVYFGTSEEELAKSKHVLQHGVSLIWQGRAAAIASVPHRIASLSDENGEGKDQAVPNDVRRASSDGEQPFVPLSQRCLAAACQFLANALWRKELQTNSKLLTKKLYGALWTTIIQTQDAEVLHAAAGLLTQLSRSSVHSREAIAEDEKAMAALERLCDHSTSQIKQDGVKLLKTIGKDSAVNQGRFAVLARTVLESIAAESNSADTSDLT